MILASKRSDPSQKQTPPSPVKIAREKIQTEPSQQPLLTQEGALLLEEAAMGDVVAARADLAIPADINALLLSIWWPACGAC